MPYNAFISYSHAADGKLAPALHLALHRFAKPWYRRRAVRIFRDKTSLSVSPALWPAIEAALSDSEYFILLASPQASASHWVQQEVDYWLGNRSTDTLLIILTDGELAWDDDSSDFNWNLTTALPPNLQSTFRQEPLYLDLRWARTKEHLSLTNPKFRESIADIAAPLHGLPKDELIGEDVRQHRRTKLAVWSFVFALAALATLASWQAYVATQQRDIAEQRTRQVTSQMIADRAQRLLEEHPVRSLILTAEALNVTLREGEGEPHVPAVEAVLREALNNVGGRGLGWYEHGNPELELSPDGRWLVTSGESNTALLWDLGAGEPTSSPIVLRGHGQSISDAAISPESNWLATWSGDQTVRLWNLQASDPATNPRIIPSQGERLGKLRFSPDGRWLIATRYDKPVSVLVWDLSTDASLEAVRVIPGPGRGSINTQISGDSRWLMVSKRNVATLWDLTDSNRQVIKLEQTTEKYIHFEISQDGRWLATRSNANVVRLLDLNQDDPEATSIELKGHVNQPSAHFSADSNWLVTYGADITQIWNLRGGKPAANPVTLAGGIVPLTSFSINPTGDKLTGLTAENAILTWDLNDLTKAPTRLRSPAQDLSAIWYSPSGKWLMASAKKQLVLWHLHPARRTPLVLSGEPGEFGFKAVFSPNDRWLVIENADYTLRVFDLSSRYPDRESWLLRGHEKKVSTKFISADSHWLITKSSDWTIRLWRLGGNDTPAGTSLLRGVTRKTVAISPDGKWIFTAGDDRFARLWRIDSSYPRDSIVLDSERDGFDAAAFSEDSRWLATGGGDRTVRLWNLKAKDPAMEPVALTGHQSRIAVVAFSPNGKWLATANAARKPTVRIWDLNSSEITESTIALGEQPRRIYSLEFSHDSRWLITRGEERKARLWDLEAQDPAANPLLVPQQKKTIRSVVIGPKSRWLVSRNDERSALLWDLETIDSKVQPIKLPSYQPPTDERNDKEDKGFEYLTLRRGHDDVISTVAFTPDGRWLVTRGHQHTASLWDLASKDPTKSRIVLKGHTKNISAVAISPNGRWLASGSADRSAAIWRLDTRNPAANPVFLRGHEAPVFDVTISPDSHWLLTRSDDQTARLWDLTAENPAGSAIVIHGDNDPIELAMFSPDSRWLLINDKRATALRLWPLRLEEVLQRARRTAGRNLTINEWRLYRSDEPYQETFPDFPWPSGPGSGESGR